jgi:SGNH domain (fused to AT3 domains)
LIGIGFFFIHAKMSFPGFWALLPTVGAGLVIASGGQGPDHHPNQAKRVIDYIGRISYPLYLWHWPLLSLGQIISQGSLSLTMKLTLISATGGLAALTYHLLEKPIRRAQGWRVPGLLLAMMVALMGIGGAIVHFGGFPDRAIEAHNPNRTERPIPGFESLAADCSTGGATEQLAPHCKLFAPENAQQTIILWGDSSAIAWTPVFLDLAKARNIRLIVIGHASCPPLLSARKTHFDLPDSAHYCQDGQLQWAALRFIEKIRPNLIVLMGAWGGYRTDLAVARENTEFMTDREGEEANRLTNKETLLRRIPETLDRLSTVAPVLMFRNWPLLPGSLPPPAQRSFKDLIRRDHPAREYPRGYFEAQRQFIDEILLAYPSDRVALFDPAATICDEQSCSNEIEGISAYSDRYHITPKAALTYREALSTLMDRLMKPD